MVKNLAGHPITAVPGVLVDELPQKRGAFNLKVKKCADIEEMKFTEPEQTGPMIVMRFDTPVGLKSESTTTRS